MPIDWKRTIARREWMDALRFVAAAAIFVGFLLSLGARFGNQRRDASIWVRRRRSPGS